MSLVAQKRHKGLEFQSGSFDRKCRLRFFFTSNVMGLEVIWKYGIQPCSKTQ